MLQQAWQAQQKRPLHCHLQYQATTATILCMQAYACHMHEKLQQSSLCAHRQQIHGLHTVHSTSSCTLICTKDVTMLQQTQRTEVQRSATHSATAASNASPHMLPADIALPCCCESGRACPGFTPELENPAVICSTARPHCCLTCKGLAYCLVIMYSSKV
jgi:hypothetical protein